jgi:hypothetical protein
MISSSAYSGQLSLLESITTSGSLSPQKQSQDPIGQKCIKCEEIKPLSCFDVFQTGGGIRNTCKGCRKEMSQLRNKLRKQNPTPPPGNCPICDKHTTTWILDHCHNTERFRGYICDRCNRGLGCFGDDPTCVQKALNYLSTNVDATRKIKDKFS